MTTQWPERRARTVALAGLAFQILLFVFFVLLLSWSGSEASRGLVLLTGVGTGVWLFLVLVCHQRVLVREETFETEQIRRERAGAGGTDAIFDVAGEQLLLARRRLRWMYRWLLPIFAILIIGALVAAGLVRWKWALGQPVSEGPWPTIDQGKAGLLCWLVGGTAFLSFLLSRYATGMAREKEWRILHAGATWLMGMTLAAVALCAALAALYFSKTPVPERVVAYALRLLLFVLAAETLLNLVLDFYRPRAAEEEPRPAFDSRLLGLFTEPGGIARSIADAINYQFGFEVSSTWFYKLLQRSVVPLVGFAIVTLFAVSCLVFVEANEVAVIERFGRPLMVAHPADPNQQIVRELGPGPHLKWPWPIEKAYKVATGQVHDLKIGIQEETPDTKGTKELFLWTNKHSWEPHLNVLVANPKLAEILSRDLGKTRSPVRPTASKAAGTQPAGRSEAVPVSQLRVSAAIQYKIRDAYQWLRNYGGAQDEGPREILQTIAKREIMQQCASVDVMGLMGTERGRVERQLFTAIQAAANQRNLGVDIVFLGLQGVHPPSDTAAAFQEVIGAESKRTATVRSAVADRNKRLTEVAGDVTRAEQLSEAIRQLNRLEAGKDVSPPQLQAARDRVQKLFFGDSQTGVLPVGGTAAQKVAKARETRWSLENRANGLAVAFEQEIATKNAAPKVYQMRKYLEMLADATAGIRKYVMAASEAPSSIRTFQLNLQDPRDVSLYQAITQEKK